MVFPLPKIIYDAGSGAVTLQFTYPPISKPGTDELTATRHDSDTISGIRQSIIERIDEYRTLQMDFVPQADEANWSAFMLYALTGEPSRYRRE